MNTDFLNDLDNYLKMKQHRLVNSVLVYENDELKFERYYNRGSENKTWPIMSVWKSLLSLTLGICLDKGLVKSLDEPISRYIPQFNMNTHIFHNLITIRHLLTMSSGIYFNPGIHYHCPMMEQMRRSADWISHIAEVQTTDYPGTKFVYKEWDVILLSALIGKACGGTAWDVAGEYLHKPLGITSQWIISKNGMSFAADADDDRTNELTARDMAKIGLLTLHGGEWNRQRIVSDEYIKAAVSPSAANSGYGFLWWLSSYGWHGRGFGGQELNVYPDKNIVVVVQATVTPSSKSYGDICENIIGGQ